MKFFKNHQQMIKLTAESVISSEPKFLLFMINSIIGTTSQVEME